MSASPADHTPGRTPGRTPNGGLPPLRRKPRGGDPLVRPKPKTKRLISSSAISHGTGLSVPNGQAQGRKGLHDISLPALHRGPPALPKPPQRSNENATSGFSSPSIAPFQDFPLILTKKALFEGHRHHVARFANKDKRMDPRNPEEFVRPVRLHRRDPRAPPAGAGAKDELVPVGGRPTGDNKEMERLAILRAEKDARREAEAALVAPASSGGHHKKIGANTKKTEQVYRNDLTEEQRARTKLRYEEALPWHLEDFDNTSTWVGSYEAALSDTYAMMVQGSDGAFRMVPLEKWYKFTQRNQFKTLTIEEAELSFAKKVKEPRWFMDSEEAKQKRQSDLSNKKASSNLFIGKWERGVASNGAVAPVTKQENADADDLDFQEDRFADDEENMLFEEDEETKEAGERIKRDQLQANIFDLKEEKEYDKQEFLEKREKDAEKKLGKRVKKALMKREKNYIYDSDSSENPYTESSDSDSSSSEADRRKAEEKEKAKGSDGTKSTPDKHGHKSKPGSGLASGNSTPSHRASKHSQPMSRTASSSNLKRPGSPLASDASGNESSRKKVKKNKHLQSSISHSQLQPPSRPGSPPLASSNTTQALPHSTSFSHKRGRAGSGSDSEGGAGSGGEMSDGTRKKMKITLKIGSRDASPTRSRAGSPGAEGAAPGTGRTDNKASNGSSGASAPAPSQEPSSTDSLPVPTAAEIRAHVPSSGITIQGLLTFFRGRVAGTERNKVFTKLMKENARFDKAKKLLFPI